MANPLWSSLDSKQRIERIMKVMERAGQERQFREDCLGLNGADSRATIEQEAAVQFDEKFVLHCYPDRETVEHQIVLLIPDVATPASAPVKDY
jgi:hypothetical protein